MPKKSFSRVLNARFVGCDGEGINTADGDHVYALFRMGEHELFEGGRRLTTPEVLSFIIDRSDPHDYLVGFAFEYDCNNILRDVDRHRVGNYPSRLERLLGIELAALQGATNPFAQARAYWTWLNFPGAPQFGVNWIGRNHLKICRAKKDPTGRLVSDPETIRTIEDVWGNFQSSFVAALERWQVGTKTVRAEIQAMKAQRHVFGEINQQVRDYNALECSLLAELMEAFRAAAIEARIIPRTWNGPGKLASAVLRDQGIIKREQIEKTFPPSLLAMARAAFYGGRFETTRAGFVNEEVIASDINSAYPASYLKLPCLEHGRFRKASAAALISAPPTAIFVAPVIFTHPPDQFLCGLPIRDQTGPISWPRAGAGVYWSPEIRSAQRLGASVTIKQGWIYERRCNCRPFAFVPRLYKARLDLGKNDKGIPLKLGKNSIYGKFVQRIGVAPFQNHLWGGLITATIRAHLNDAIRTAGPRNVLMLAADAIFTVKQPPAGKVSVDGLGEWDRKTYPGMTIVQPGLYWPQGGKRKLKTRGVSAKYFEPLVPAFEAAWADYSATAVLFDGGKPPVVPVEVETFISLRLAYRLNKPELGCRWTTLNRLISFDWKTKRAFGRWSDDRESAILDPLPGNRDRWSMTYDELGKRTLIRIDGDGLVSQDGELLPSDVKDLLEALPDPVDLSPPFLS